MSSRRIARLWVLLLAGAASLSATEPLPAPEKGQQIRVAFLLARGANVIDFTGSWEVFQDVHIPERGTTHAEVMPFELYTVAETPDPVLTTGGMQVLPDYTFETAPQPDVIVVPALTGSPALHAWLREASAGAHLTMSVCTGAFQLARAGLLEGLRVTTHHEFLDKFAEEFPAIRLERGVRWVDNGTIASAAGLTSGIDLALHVVARYFGPDVARRTAEFLEHASTEWMGEASGG